MTNGREAVQPGTEGFSPTFTTSGVRSTNTCFTVASGNVPVVGFVAWERSFPQNPDGNYGRLIDHSFIQSTAGVPTTPPTP